MSVSLRERARGKQRGSLRYRLAVEDPWPAERVLADAEADLEVARGESEEPDPQKVALAEKAVEQAKAARDACYEVITLRAMQPTKYEKLMAAHPPTEEQKARNPDAIYNAETLAAPILAASVEGDMTEADWQEFLDNSSLGEANSLIQACVIVNIRAPDPNVGKGSA